MTASDPVSPDATPLGSIALIGGGPGDVDLLTLRAVERLRAADVILYDDLAGDEILSFARPDAELIAVGKRAGHPSPKQQEVSRLMIGYARLGKRVVRVKSGDPSIFARADEEIGAARAAGVPIEIVPGITTATAAAAYLGTSLTKRGVARRIQMITGHDVDGRLADGNRSPPRRGETARAVPDPLRRRARRRGCLQCERPQDIGLWMRSRPGLRSYRLKR